ncbi:MAG: hypothetical protein H0S79_15775 [Anaerolineaceae bacterium]|nr:hypothetical protein [Anaerolineaceae bacterium]
MSGDYLAIDIGGSSVKLFAGKLDNNRIVICDKQTIPNKPLSINGHVYVDIYGLYGLLRTKIGQMCSSGLEPISLGIDTYGNGYGVLDKDHRMIGLPLFYKDPSLQGALQKISQRFSLREIYEQTGLFPADIRVLTQLLSEAFSQSSRLIQGKHLLLLPDLLCYLFTGDLRAERSIASVASLLDREGSNWCFDLFKEASVPATLFPPIVDGWREDTRVPFLPEVSEALNLQKANFVRIVSHDTESALLAAPKLDKQKLFISMGTSVICGIQTDGPIICDEGFQREFKNIYGAFGNYSLCRDFNGLWILEKCMEHWRCSTPSLSYHDVISACELERGGHSFIDVCDPSIKFYKDNMPEAINAFCLRTGQDPVHTIGDIANCVFASIALKIKSIYGEIRELTGRKDINGICVVGGAVENDILMKMVSDALSLPLYKGSKFSASIGNLLMQMYTNRELSSLEEIKEIAMNSCDMEVVLPNGSREQWEEAMDRMNRVEKEVKGKENER